MSTDNTARHGDFGLTLDEYIRHKLKMLEVEFCIKLTESDFQHFLELESKIAVDQFAHTILKERL